MENSKIKFILASASPRRKELIGHLNLPFTILTKNIPEVSNETDPVAFSAAIAKEKGLAVYDDLNEDNVFVVSADTIVCLAGKIYGKPKDKAEAKLFLKELSGKSHSVFTAVSVMFRFKGQDHHFSFVEESRVSFAKISEALLENYLATGDSLDKAGAYGIQGASLTFISRVDGCYANVVGFPLSRFVGETEKFLKQFYPNEASWFRLF